MVDYAVRKGRRVWLILLAALLSVPMAGVIAVVLALVLLLVASVSLGPCDFSVPAAPNRDTCSGSASPLVAASVKPGGGPVAARLAAGDKPNVPDAAGNLALPCAAMVGNSEAVHRLLLAKADPTRDGFAGGRPIVAAVSGEGRVGNEAEDDPSVRFEPVTSPVRVRIVVELVRAGANPGLGLAPAAEKGNATMVTVLMGLGASPNGVASQPNPLLSAVFGNSSAVVDLLLSRGADPNGRGTLASADVLQVFFLIPNSSILDGLFASLPPEGRVPPIVAAALPIDTLVGGQGILTHLLDARADINALAFGAYSALALAVLTRNYAAAIVLHSRGALDAPAGGRSAFAFAAAAHDQKMMAILEH